MDKKKIYGISAICLLLTIGLIGVLIEHSFGKSKSQKETNKIDATVMSISKDEVTVQDSQNIIYTFLGKDINASVGSKVQIEYSGSLDKNKDVQENQIIGYQETTNEKDENGIPTAWLDNGIFGNFYILANNRLKKMTLDEKIGQLLLVRYPDQNAITDLQKYQFGGYLFFAKDFNGKTEQQVKEMISSAQKAAKIPLLTAVDEEGGNVVRVSSNPNLRATKFLSPRELYQEGGFDKIKSDTIEKSELLKKLGLNLNLAPVVDVSTNPNDYMYNRSLGENTELTSTFAKTVIEAGKGTGVSYTLKHFPGYGNNADTHTTGNRDARSYDDIYKNDLPPFKSGISAGAEAVLVSHNTVDAIDSQNPASLSPSVHNLLRNELAFTGIIITDDLAMGAVSGIENATLKAIQAGNDLIITTDYAKSFNEIKTAVENKTIDEGLIDKLAFRVIAWKYYKGLMYENAK